eukprot:gnl/MRDRNA2_/MRDRNA2_21693_c0_seq1.p1 gnl/MRDRNA2_/MRDRNA2_21693_c0~~gnl/MRDRNA2_/MRDRNA2_21693_c0_seq1.p1  ORF type:complete len:497 (+),score=92.73 gnl/MRDRNA2_/MRDRNA2_21693_c0_seq1:177-1493(+)
MGGVVEMVSTLALGEGSSNFPVLRMLRLLKIGRLVRVVHHLRELRMLMSAMWVAVQTLFWAWIVILVVVYIFAILYKRVLSDADFADDEAGRSETWGTVLRCCFTLFSIMTLDDWVDVVRPMWNIAPGLIILTIIFIIITSFGLLNTVIAVVVERTLQIGQKSNEETLTKMTRNTSIQDASDPFVRFFRAADTDGDGNLTLEEFQNAVRDHSRPRMPLDDDLSLLDAEVFFSLLDAQGHGYVSVEDFLDGAAQLHGMARAQQLLKLNSLLVRASGSSKGRLKNLIMKLEHTQDEQMHILSSLGSRKEALNLFSNHVQAISKPPEYSSDEVARMASEAIRNALRDKIEQPACTAEGKSSNDEVFWNMGSLHHQPGTSDSAGPDPNSMELPQKQESTEDTSIGSDDHHHQQQLNGTQANDFHCGCFTPRVEECNLQELER